MKKTCFLFFALIIALLLPFSALAAGVAPIETPGDASNPADYLPPPGTIRTMLPDSAQIGTHVYRFDCAGNPDPNGHNPLTLIVAIATDTAYTRVARWSWSGNYPLLAVIVQGPDSFNLYGYYGGTDTDTDPTAPVDGIDPANIESVSVVLALDGRVSQRAFGFLDFLLLVAIVALLAAILIVIINIFCAINRGRCKR